MVVEHAPGAVATLSHIAQFPALAVFGGGGRCGLWLAGDR